MTRPSTFKLGPPWGLQFNGRWEIVKMVESRCWLNNGKGRQKEQNFTVKTRKNWTNREGNSLIDQRIDDNFHIDIDKVRGFPRSSPNDTIPCQTHQASIRDYRSEKTLDGMTSIGLDKVPREARATRRSIEGPKAAREVVIWEIAWMESQLDVANAKTIYKNK